MRHTKALFTALVLLAGFSASASAQQFGVGGAQGGGFGFGQSYGFGGTGFGRGYNSGYSGLNSGFGNFSGYNGGYGPTGFGYGTYNYQPIPQTTNNMFGLMNSIQSQTGGGNSYRRGNAVGGRRR